MSSTNSWPTKTPAEHLDYIIDWSTRLKTDRIANSAFTLMGANTGVSITANSFSNTTTTVWLNGGTDGETEIVRNVVTTVGGRTLETVVNILIKNKTIS